MKLIVKLILTAFKSKEELGLYIIDNMTASLWHAIHVDFTKLALVGAVNQEDYARPQDADIILDVLMRPNNRRPYKVDESDIVIAVYPFMGLEKEDEIIADIVQMIPKTAKDVGLSEDEILQGINNYVGIQIEPFAKDRKRISPEFITGFFETLKKTVEARGITEEFTAKHPRYAQALEEFEEDKYCLVRPN